MSRSPSVSLNERILLGRVDEMSGPLPLPILQARQGRGEQHEERTEVTHPGLPSSRNAVSSVSGGRDPYASFHPGEGWLCVSKWDNLTPGESSSAFRGNFVHK